MCEQAVFCHEVGPPAIGASSAGVSTREFLKAVSVALATINEGNIVAVTQAVHTCLLHHRQVFLMGNGGSCATASHLATDLAIAAYAAKLPGRITALNDNPSLVTALANDVSFADSGAILVETSASAGDVLLIFTGSGRSPNLVRAARAAELRGVVTVLIGSTAAPPDFPATHRVLVASDRYSVIEAAHSAIAHALSDLLRSYARVEVARCSDRRSA